MDNLQLVTLSSFFLLSFVFTSCAGQDVSAAMKMNEIVPDVVNTAPTEPVQVIYGDEYVVNLGNEITPRQAKDVPSVHWKNNDDSYYLIGLTAPDSPSRENPVMKEIIHWLVCNIPGDKVDQGEVLFGYRGAGPANGTDIHRYVFLVYKQPNKINFEEPHVNSSSMMNRRGFSIQNFAQNYSLGDPIAGNFFMAQYDDYVSELRASMKD